MDESKTKKRNKNKHRYPYYGSVFAPLFLNHFTTPKATPGIGDASAATLTATAPSESIPPSRSRSLYEMRKCLGMSGLVEDGPALWAGYSNLAPQNILMRKGGPTIGGPGYGPYVEPGQGGRYDFAKSPGLGFNSQYAWKVWEAVLDIMQNNPALPINQLMQTAMNRSGVKYSQLDSSEVRLLEMGVEWYLSDPAKFNKSKDSDNGAGGVPGSRLSGG